MFTQTLGQLLQEQTEEFTGDWEAWWRAVAVVHGKAEAGGGVEVTYLSPKSVLGNAGEDRKPADDSVLIISCLNSQVKGPAGEICSGWETLNY